MTRLRPTRPIAVGTLVMLGALAIASCVPPADVGFEGVAVTADPNDIAAGKGLFQANCMQCHHADAKGPPNIVGKTFAQLRAKQTDGPMQRIKAMPDAYVKALEAYLGSLAP